MGADIEEIMMLEAVRRSLLDAEASQDASQE